MDPRRRDPRGRQIRRRGRRLRIFGYCETHTRRLAYLTARSVNRERVGPGSGGTRGGNVHRCATRSCNRRGIKRCG
jgi:hypothetical protein